MRIPRARIEAGAAAKRAGEAEDPGTKVWVSLCMSWVGDLVQGTCMCVLVMVTFVLDSFLFIWPYACKLCFKRCWKRLYQSFCVQQRPAKRTKVEPPEMEASSSKVCEQGDNDINSRVGCRGTGIVT